MAVAPKPGVQKRRKAAEAASKLWVITVRGEEFPATAYKNLPIRDMAAIRDHTSRPLDYWLYPISTESVRVLCWVAERVNGKPELGFGEFEAGFLERFPDLEPSDIGVDEDDGAGDDPQL